MLLCVRLLVVIMWFGFSLLLSSDRLKFLYVWLVCVMCRISVCDCCCG